MKDLLDRLYEKYDHPEFIGKDPLQFVYHYSARPDREIAALLASCLAYGRVEQIEKSLTELFGQMGDSPSEFVRDFDSRKRAKLQNFKHRFTAGDDISDLLELLKEVIKQHGGIETFFAAGCKAGDKNIIPALTNFCESLLKMHAQKRAGQLSGGLKYLLPSPAAGSPCKRLNLFLRWMVRDDNVDTGLWKSIDKSKLIVPLDTHMTRLCRILGLYKRKTASLASAVEITESFARIEPADPVKYDFALCRIGIIENCTGRHGPACPDCQLLTYCQQKK